MSTQIEVARMMVYKAAWAKHNHYKEGGPRHTKEASMAKLFAGGYCDVGLGKSSPGLGLRIYN